MSMNLPVVKTHHAKLSTHGQLDSIGNIRFDWVMIVFSSWLVGGLYLDGWAHHHITTLDTFFTPWHAVFYSGFLVTAIVLVGALIRNHTKGHPWRRALPAGYELSLLGVPVFAIGGVGDMIWHMLFGIEVDVEALLSPTHLLLATGIMLIVSGPLRATWRRPDAESAQHRVSQFPMLVSLALTLSLFSFFTLFAHPFGEPLAAPQGYPLTESSATSIILNQSLGVAGILLQTGLLMGMVLPTVQRWTLRPGALTLVFTLNAALLVTIHDRYTLILVAFLAGIVADLLVGLLKPSTTRIAALRLFAFFVPTVLYLFYFLTLILTSGISWSIHLWLGSTLLAGIAGLLLSYVRVPLPGPY